MSYNVVIHVFKIVSIGCLRCGKRGECVSQCVIHVFSIVSIVCLSGGKRGECFSQCRHLRVYHCLDSLS